MLWVPVWQIKLLNTFPGGATDDWCQVPQLSILSFDVQADWLTRWHHVNTGWLHWAMFLSSVIHSDTSKRHTILPKQWGRIPLESVSVSIMGDLQQETEAAALYFILIALSQASLSRALTPSAFVLCPVCCCSAQMETSANSSQFSQLVENLEKALFKHHQHNNERETTNRKRFWETDMRKPATNFPILCNNNFHPAPAACCSSGIVNFNFSRASLLLISPVIHHNTAGRQHQHHQGPTFEVKHTKSTEPFLSQMCHVEHMSARYMDNLKHLRLCATACQNVDACVTAENRRK